MPEPAVHVFAGPSIPHALIRALLPDAVLHAPVEHGSVLALRLRPGDRVAIIDGVFFRSAPVRHKELLELLDGGVGVYGASSMGALRAAELDAFGMVGVGLVYRMYSSGLLDRDDEVAIAHASAAEHWAPLSEALVAIRVAARRARIAGVVDRRGERAIVEAARGMDYRARRYPAVLAAARDLGLPAAATSRFLTWLDTHTDVKRRDAERLLTVLRRASPAAGGTGLLGAEPLARTSFLASWITSFAGEPVDAAHVPDAATLAFCKLFAPDYPAFHRAQVLSWVAGVSASESGASLTSRALERASRRGLIPGTGLPATMRPWLSEAEAAGPAQQAIATVLVRSFRSAPGMQPDAAMIEALRPQPAWRRAQHHVARALAFNTGLVADEPRYHPDRLTSARVSAWYAAHWDTDRVDLAMLDRGITSERELALRGGMFLPFAVSEGVPRFTLAG